MASIWNPEVDVCLTDSDDEDVDEGGRDWKSGRECMLFVLDANLYADEERFVQALEMIRNAFVSGLLMNDKDLMGLMLANTEHSPDPYEPGCLEHIVVPQNCAVFLPLHQLTKYIVEHLLHFLATASDKFGEEYGYVSRGTSYASMLRLCLNLFDNASYECNSAKIVYLTDIECPHTSDSQEFQMALQKANDLEGRAMEFHVIPMKDDFNYDLFYKEFLCLVKAIDIESFQPADPQQLRELLSNRKLKQDYSRRTLGHFKFSLGANLEISAQYYNFFKKRLYPRKVRALRKNNAIVRSKNVITVSKRDEATSEIIEEYEVKSTGGWYQLYTGEKTIKITPEQILRVKNMHAPGMMLLGFKPSSTLDNFVPHKPSNFMYPDDQTIIGSKRLFRALWQRCRARNKIAVCLFLRKKRSIPRYVALVPVSTEDNEGSDMQDLLSRDGFKIIYLPMGKHIRHINFNDWNIENNESPPEGVELFQKIIKKLRINYQPAVINDPGLEQLQARILALALDIQTDNDGLTVMPSTEKQDERIASILPKIEEIFGKDVEVAKKRAATGTAEETASKKAKINEDDLKKYEYVQQLIRNEALITCTNAQLRTILSTHFEVTPAKSTTKPDLIEKIKNLSN
ncbi:ATP-dependent DNA helicase 2 subunit 1-like [Teleopsis dalmanni]|uniref:ATP-dependent DNA helicase 2 subunit 1-like n=1 Tax=Teleopsis dalmanni TaxID=139649 RepID=UPI0018CCC29D|nr:ATP-dependent DNA helicase 2 subunit 1-like [Teleopsis dalmanni]